MELLFGLILIDAPPAGQWSSKLFCLENQWDNLLIICGWVFLKDLSRMICSGIVPCWNFQVVFQSNTEVTDTYLASPAEQIWF